MQVSGSEHHSVANGGPLYRLRKSRTAGDARHFSVKQVRGTKSNSYRYWQRIRACTNFLEWNAMLVIFLNIRILGAMKAANVFETWTSVLQDDPHSYTASLYVGLSASAFASLGGGVAKFFLGLYGNLCGASKSREWRYSIEHILDSAVAFCLLGDIIACMRLSFDYWVYYEQGGDAYVVYRALSACMLVTHFGRYGIVELLVQNIRCLSRLIVNFQEEIHGL